MFESVHTLLSALGDVGTALAEAGESVRVVVIGGAALLLLDDSPGASTRDIDVAAVLSPDNTPVTDAELPPALTKAATQVARIRGLGPGWFNNSVVLSFGVQLPEGAISRGTEHHFGGLTVIAVSRIDLIALKFYAAVGRSFDVTERHALDLERLRPTAHELEFAERWARTRLTDPSAFAEQILDLNDRLMPDE